MKLRLLIILFFIVGHEFAFGQPYSSVVWQRKTGPAGGEITDIEYHSASGKLFAIAGTRRKLYISTDNGSTWTEKSTGAGNFNYFNDIEITNNTVYLTGSYSVWSSADAGVSFTEIFSDQNFNNGNELRRLSTGRLVVLGNGGVYYSDNGANFAAGYNSTGIDGRWLISTSSDQLFIVKDQVPYRSNDLGINFTSFTTGLPLGTQVFSLAVNTTGTTIYCVTGTGIYSNTGSGTWTSHKGGTITDATLSDFSNESSFIEFSADGLGMYFIDNVNQKLHAKGSAEPAAAWTQRQTSFPTTTVDVSVASVKDYPTANTSIAFFGSSGGIYKTTSGGTTYSESNSGLSAISAEQLEADANGNLYMRSGFETLLKSTDGGNTWARVGGITGIYHFSLNPNRTVLYLCDSNGPFRSTNYAGSWSPLTVAALSFVEGLFAADNDKVFALNNESFYYSSNQGTTFTASPVAISGFPGGSGFSIYYNDVYFASADLMLVKLYDHNVDAYKLYKVAFTYNGSNVITSAVASEILNSPIAVSDINSIHAANGRFFLIDPYGNPNDQIAVTSNGGTSWDLRNLSTSISDVFVAYNGYIFTTENTGKKVNISRDDGATFQSTVLNTTLGIYDIADIEISPTGIANIAWDGEFLWASAKTIVTPTAPSGLAKYGDVANAAALSWNDNSNNEEQFEIFQSTDGVNFTNVGNSFDYCNTPGARGFYTATGLSPSTNYTFRVVAENEAGSSAYSQVSFTTPASCTQTIPDNRSWSAVNSGSSGFAIVAPKTVGIIHLGGGRYKVSDISLGTLNASPFFSASDVGYFREGCGQTFVEGSDDDDIKPFESEGTWNGTNSLTLKWRACEADEYETIVLTLASSDPAPAAPISPLAYSLTSSSIEVNWQSGYYQKTYVVERSTNGVNFTQVGTVNFPTTRYVDNGPLSLGTTYYYRIKAQNGNTPTPGESAYSATASVQLANPKFLLSSTTVANEVAATVGSYWADFNNDGFQDYMTLSFDPITERGTTIIFRNDGAGNFIKVTPTFDTEEYFVAALADYDNDGFTDILLTEQESSLADLYKGNGDFTFSKVLSAGDVTTISAENIEISSASWSDINNDGLLDLLVMAYDQSSGNGKLLLYKQNVGNTFTKIAGGELATDIVRASAAFWADYNNDRFQDVIISNVNGVCRLYENNGDETFTKKNGTGFDASGAFSIAWGDYNNDGNMDIYAGSFTQNALYKNNGDESFTKDISTSISEAAQTIGSAWGDFNNDGYLDLISSGFGTTQTRLFIRDASNPSNVVFTKYTNEKINDLSISHYGASVADYDLNGYVDIALSSFLFGTNDDIGVTNIGLFKNNIMTGNWSKVKIVPTTGNKEGIAASVRLTAGGVTQKREFLTSNSMVSRSSTAPHFGIGSNTSITSIQVKWANGDIQTLTNPPINQLITIPQDNQGPVITAKTPAHLATNVPANTTITITLDASTAAASKNLVLTPVGSGTPTYTIAVISATKTGDVYTFSLPGALLANTNYAVTLDAGAFVDIYSNPSAAISGTSWTFTTADDIAPVITFTPTSTMAKGFGTANPTATVTDNVAVTSVVVKIRKIGGSAYSDLVATAGASNTWTIALSESAHFDGNGTEFYIEAKDAANNIGRSPASGTHKIRLTFTGIQASIPGNFIGIGGQASSWKAFSIPFELASPHNAVSAVFNQFAGLENTVDYRLITYGSATQWSEYPSFNVLQRGKGYFINFKTDPGSINLPTELTAPANDRSNLYSMTLQPGWNMIGNPYLSQVNWSDVKTFNSAVSGAGSIGALTKFTGTGYSASTQTLEAYEGAFVNNTGSSPVTFTIPFAGQTSLGGRTNSDELGTDINRDSWMTSINIQQKGLVYEMAGIGMAPDANLTIDHYDAVPPPRFIEYLDVNFNHPEHFQKRFTRDIVPTQDSYNWEFNVGSNVDGEANLYWDQTALQGAKELWLLDLSRQILVNMKETGKYSFNPKESANFRVYFGENLKISPEKVILGKAFPNPTSGLTSMTFSLPESGGLNQNVTLEIIDGMGRPMGMIAQGSFNPGYHELTWNAKELTNGFYTYRLTVKGAQGRTTHVNKLIIK
jgi:photosystem II stability/assembly factor-like uncharacterized protein